MADCRSIEELLALGFTSVGANTRVSLHAVFHSVTGKLGDGVRIDDFAVLTGNLNLADGAHVSTHCFVGGSGALVSFGAGSGIAAGTAVYTKSEDYSQTTLGSKIVGPVTLEAGVAIGSHCTIMPNSTIGAGAKIGANAVVNGFVRPHTINVSRAASLITVADFGASKASA